MLKGIDSRAHNIRAHKRRIKTPKPRYWNVGEPTVVAGWQLANVLRAWIDQWRIERPVNDPHFMGAVEYLAFHTGLNHRRINGLVKSEFPTVGETQVDKILRAIDKEFLLHTELKVMPNPGWDLEKWLEWRSEQGCT